MSLKKPQSAPVKSTFEDDFEFVGRGPKYLDSPFDNEASLFKEEKDNSSSFTAKQFGNEKANFHSSKVRKKLKGWGGTTVATSKVIEYCLNARLPSVYMVNEQDAQAT